VSSLVPLDLCVIKRFTERVHKWSLNVLLFMRGCIEHPGWEQQFNGWFGLFRFESCRDTKWYAEAEPIYRARVQAAEEYLDPSEGCTREEPPPGIYAGPALAFTNCPGD
jgi:hypothetical protein